MKVSFCHYINFLQHLFSHAKLPNSPSPHEIHNVAAQIYAISLDALVQGKDEITAYLFNTGDPAKPWTTKTSRNDCSTMMTPPACPLVSSQASPCGQQKQQAANSIMRQVVYNTLHSSLMPDIVRMAHLPESMSGA